MPAQWPIFINNLSQKLASRSSKGPDDIGAFFANEYFNAIKTAQTPFGNIHKSGQKSILEEGFKKAFNILFKSAEPQLEDKFGNSLYNDMFEKLPEIDLSTNPDCEFEEWVIKNKDTIDPFAFYPLFPTTCIIPKPIVPETNLFGDIDITSENVDSQPELRYVTMSVVGGDGISPYEFTYSLNGEIQPKLTSDSTGIVRFLAPTNPGKYEYFFISAIDASKKAEIKNINRSASIEIKEDTKAIEIKVDPPTAFQLVKPMTEAQQVDELANRVIYQNDASKEYLDWVERLPYHGALAKKVSEKALDFLDKETNAIKNSTGIIGLPQTNAMSPINVSGYNYTSQFNSASDTFRKAKLKYDKLSAKESIEKKYARVEVIRSEILLTRIELAYRNFNSNNGGTNYLSNRVDELNRQLTIELQLINIAIIKKNIDEIKDVDSIDFIMANIKLYQNELVLAKYRKDDKKIDTLNRELTAQSLRVVKLKNKIKKDAATNDRLFQEEYEDRPDSIPKFITSKFICIFTYVDGIDNNQKGQARTEQNRLKLKLAKYDIEKIKYRDLKIRNINQLAEDNKKAENPGGDDAYGIMAKSIIDYWKSTAVQPFEKTPPILPCLIPDPGIFIPVNYGDEAKLGAELKRAWNTGKRFKLEPTIQTATKAVAAAVAVSCANHLKDLKFIYNGKIPVGPAVVPMIGFSPLAF